MMHVQSKKIITLENNLNFGFWTLNYHISVDAQKDKNIDFSALTLADAGSDETFQCKSCGVRKKYIFSSCNIFQKYNFFNAENISQ